MSPVNTELSGFTVRAGRGVSGSDSDAVLSSLIDVIGNFVYISHMFFFFVFIYFVLHRTLLFIFISRRKSQLTMLQRKSQV